MKLDLSQYTKNTDKTYDVDVSFERDFVSKYGVDYPVSASKPFSLSIFNDSGKSLFISGKSDISFTVPCDRCLSDVDITVSVVISEEITITDDGFSVDSDEATIEITDNHIDLDFLITNQIIENWPVKILCSDDCKGICPVCGKNLNLFSCDCDRQVLDPRMQQFQDVFKDFKEV